VITAIMLLWTLSAWSDVNLKIGYFFMAQLE